MMQKALMVLISAKCEGEMSKQDTALVLYVLKLYHALIICAGNIQMTLFLSGFFLFAPLTFAAFLLYVSPSPCRSPQHPPKQSLLPLHFDLYGSRPQFGTMAACFW